MKPYNEYTPEEIDAFRRGELEALSAWYTENEFAETIRLVWADSCESFCSCLDSDYPRDVVIADVTRAAHIAVFGAIRRAAQEARDWEAFGGNGDSIRRAIRSAIGSEKT